MRGSDNLHRSNMILLGLVLLMLLYGIIYRVQTGDNKLYLFGFEIELPFGQKQEVQEVQEDAGEAASDGDARLLRAIDELLG